MKKIIFFIAFIGVLTFSNNMKAQTNRETVSTNQKSDDGVLIAYPNPAKDFILLKAKDSSLKIKTVTFYSILGMQVAQFTINSNAAEIDLDRFRPGKYLIRYTLSDNTQKVTQIIKQ